MNFYARVYQITKKIPKGRVATSGQIAAMISTARAARVVGFALRSLPADTPWHRVINSKGMISIENINCPPELQAKLLVKEGIKVELIKGNY
ncbi:MAG: MGMT family protein, partial [Candidatus Komeilibacteria bacterium]|nr:MGMT family protein [Candidatus Komeilibacteria bacterium]